MIVATLLSILEILLVFGSPVAVAVFFVVSTILFCVANAHPEKYSAEQIKKRKTRYIVSLIILLVMIAIIIAFFLLLANAIAYM